MLAMDAIEPTLTEWAALNIFASNQDGTLQLCVDYRNLNSLTVPDSCSTPRMDEYVHSLGDVTVSSTLNANRGYVQVGIADED